MKFLFLLSLVFAVGSVVQEFYGPRSLAQELNHLTAALHLTDAQRSEIQPLLQEHQHRIHELLASNPTLSRTDLAPQIHAVSNETHREIDALLTPSQQQLAKQLEQRGHAPRY